MRRSGMRGRRFRCDKNPSDEFAHFSSKTKVIMDPVPGLLANVSIVQLPITWLIRSSSCEKSQDLDHGSLKPLLA
jgi:hypothetical protein